MEPRVADSRCIVIAGLGSVGRRHLRNLKALGWQNVVLLRTHQSTLPDDELAGLPVETSIERALAYEPVGVIIATPTACHLEVALPAAAAGCHLLIEKPLSHTLDGIDLLQGAVRKRDVRVLVGFQFRFHPGLQTVKRLLEEDAVGAILSVHAHMGEYLPQWHPWEDYRRSYSARKDLGGGVVLTLSHPFDYVRWLVGDAVAISAFIGRRGGLEIEVEDTAEILVQLASGAIGQVHLDYIQLQPSHWLSIIGQEGTIRWDNRAGAVHCFRSRQGKEEMFSPPQGFERNAMFLSEMRHFLACIDGTEMPVCTLEDGARALHWALAAKESVAEERVIRIG